MLNSHDGVQVIENKELAHGGIKVLEKQLHTVPKPFSFESRYSCAIKPQVFAYILYLLFIIKLRGLKTDRFFYQNIPIFCQSYKLTILPSIISENGFQFVIKFTLD